MRDRNTRQPAGRPQSRSTRKRGPTGHNHTKRPATRNTERQAGEASDKAQGNHKDLVAKET